MRIIAYTYEADMHCPACTFARFGREEPGDECDAYGIPYEVVDREGNPVRPVFSTDENDWTHCGDCFEEL